MVLEHELTASYAAGSLGGTLGRLNESLRRLSRAHSTGSREKPGQAADERFMEPPRLTYLNQTLRLMADLWQSRTTASRPSDRIEKLLDHLKENALGSLGSRSGRPGRHLDYQLLAQVLSSLKASQQNWM